MIKEEVMKIGIIGFGVVGKAVANTFTKISKIKKYDKYQDLDSFNSLIDSDFIFLTVPTPFDCKRNEVDDSAVVESLKRLENLNFSNVVVIKSTLPPGSCDRYTEIFNLNLVFNPEFLRESTSPNEDFEKQRVVVIGTRDEEIYGNTKKMYERVLVPDAIYYHTTFLEAEMIKIAQNAMLASRVALANMIFDACEQNGVVYNTVREIAFDSFDILGPHMTQVPGPDGNRGFGGKCLPKDIRAFSTIYNSDLLESIIGYNDSLREDLDKFLDNYKN